MSVTKVREVAQGTTNRDIFRRGNLKALGNVCEYNEEHDRLAMLSDRFHSRGRYVVQTKKLGRLLVCWSCRKRLLANESVIASEHAAAEAAR